MSSRFIDELAPELVAAARLPGPPARIVLTDYARTRMRNVAQLCGTLSSQGVTVRPAFSVKTNPRTELIEIAMETGFAAEVISPDELAWATRVGFVSRDIVYNGPVPLPEGTAPPLGHVFADSVESFVRCVRTGSADVPGVRLRPSMIDSRFGIPPDDMTLLTGAFEGVAPEARVGVSFHARREDFHRASWRDVAHDVLNRAVEIERNTRCRISTFDVGGGWTPAEFDETFASDIAWLTARIGEQLPRCSLLIAEPGQAILTPTAVLIGTVLEVRVRPARREVIVDLGYPDWPLMHTYDHPIYVWREPGWATVGPGPDRLGGRTCLEYDVVDGLAFPDDIRVGDRVAIGDTGSYDDSMTFAFAHGAVSESL